MPKSVLVADDSLTIRKVIGMLFAVEDFTLTTVDNGLDALSKARELRPESRARRLHDARQERLRGVRGHQERPLHLAHSGAPARR